MKKVIVSAIYASIVLFSGHLGAHDDRESYEGHGRNHRNYEQDHDWHDNAWRHNDDDWDREYHNNGNEWGSTGQWQSSSTTTWQGQNVIITPPGQVYYYQNPE